MADDTPPVTIDPVRPQDADTPPGQAPAGDKEVINFPPAEQPRCRKWLRWIIILLVFSVAVGVSGYSPARYWALNHANVRSSASVTLIDEVTQQPLQHVRVTVAGKTAHSNREGTARLAGIRLGPTTLIISQPGFAEVRRQVTIGWGSNPFDRMKLKAIGVPYPVKVTDWLSGKPIKGAHIESVTAAAVSDDNGSAMLILPNNEAKDAVAVTIAAAGYRTEDATLKAAVPVPVGLVTSRKAVYVTKESGTYDVYASDVDGRNRQVLLAGTGNEGSNISLATSPDGSYAALVSTRDKQYDADGYPLSALTLIDVRNGTSTVLSHADQLQLIDWIGTRLVFVQAAANEAKRYTISSYDYASNSRFQLAAAARFNSVLSAQGMIYYAVTSNTGDPSVQPYFYRVGPDGGNRQTLLEKEVWSVYRTAYDTFMLQTGDTWYSHTVSTRRNIIGSAPDVRGSKLFIDRPGPANQSLWVDANSAKASLMLHTKEGGKDAVIFSQQGVAYPVRWLTEDSAIFRVVSAGETADYAVGAVAGRPAHKIADVANTYGFSVGQ